MLRVIALRRSRASRTWRSSPAIPPSLTRARLSICGRSEKNLASARYYTSSGTSIQAKGIEPDAVVEEELLEDMNKAPENVEGEANLRGHLRSEGNNSQEENGSSSYAIELLTDAYETAGTDAARQAQSALIGLACGSSFSAWCTSSSRSSLSLLLIWHVRPEQPSAWA